MTTRPCTWHPQTVKISVSGYDLSQPLIVLSGAPLVPNEYENEKYKKVYACI